MVQGLDPPQVGGNNMDAGPEAASLLWASEMLFSCVSRARWSPAMCCYLAVILQKPELATSDVWVEHGLALPSQASPCWQTLHPLVHEATINRYFLTAL